LTARTQRTRDGAAPLSRDEAAARWEAYWSDHEAAGYVNVTPQLVETLQTHVELRGARVLEIGAGTGGNAVKLAALGARVTAVDLAPSALARITETADAAGVHMDVVAADAAALPFAAGSFDVVYHQGFLEHFHDPLPLVREQHRVLRSGGYLLVDVPQQYNWYTVHKRRLMRAGRWSYGGWECEFSLAELKGLLQREGFGVIDAYGRGYYPRPLEMLRNLGKIEQKLLRRHDPPSGVWRWYDARWRRFERTWLGCNTLQCVGVLARAEEVT